MDGAYLGFQIEMNHTRKLRELVIYQVATILTA
jgi:hypothetical protein